MLGVGAPPALQLNVSSRPSRTVRFSGGDSMTGAEATLRDTRPQQKKRGRKTKKWEINKQTKTNKTNENGELN